MGRNTGQFNKTGWQNLGEPSYGEVGHSSFLFALNHTILVPVCLYWKGINPDVGLSPSFSCNSVKISLLVVFFSRCCVVICFFFHVGNTMCKLRRGTKSYLPNSCYIICMLNGDPVPRPILRIRVQASVWGWADPGDQVQEQPDGQLQGQPEAVPRLRGANVHPTSAEHQVCICVGGGALCIHCIEGLHPFSLGGPSSRIQ